jgi:thiosulfate reductase cytochrome b subunit
MTRALRWQHGLVMVSFVTLAYTGFALKYPESWWAAPVLRWESRFGLRGWLHRSAALFLLAALGWHLAHVATSRRLRGCLRGLAWSWSDVTDAIGAFRARRAHHHGAFGYVEKVEYWAFLWGTAVMALTGFLLWFENVSLRWLPKWATDVATAIHYYEAILATGAILVWHLYWVVFDPDVYPMDGSWWHGKAPAARDAERTPRSQA